MKARDWQRRLEELRRAHGKTLFSVTELANLAGTSQNVLNVQLSRLRKQEIIERYAYGKYGLPGAVTIESLLQSIDSHAYVTGLYALHFHNLVTQVPTRITCFTDRRSPRARQRQTPLGRLVFVCLRSSIYSSPSDGMAGPEQALCDFVYLARREGLRPEGQATFRNLDRLQTATLNRNLERYPMTVQKSVRKLVLGGPGLVLPVR
jgi:hypothetical protein